MDGDTRLVFQAATLDSDSVDDDDVVVVGAVKAVVKPNNMPSTMTTTSTQNVSAELDTILCCRHSINSFLNDGI